MNLPTKLLERRLFKDGYASVIGIDEVGMGCLAGPVVVCAVSFSREFYTKPSLNLSPIRDSKLLSPRQRESCAKELLKTPDLRYQISYCYPQTIDKINIYQAARKAMRRAVQRLANHESGIRNYDRKLNPNSQFIIHNSKTIVLVDGPTKIKNLNVPQLPIIRGDRTVFAIACASIIAKVHRDRMMARYAKKFPQYGFERHKGYGTRLHVAMLAKHGPTTIHRQSFAPVAHFL